MLEGRMRHRDNRGHESVLDSGDVQWMTAGRGIVHSEMPEQKEGRMRGFQLWVNLPARLKMSEPKFQELPDAKLPVETRDGGVRVKVIAGRTARGTQGPIDTDATEAVYFDVTLPAGATLAEPLPAGLAAFVVAYEGALRFDDGRRLDAIGLAELGPGDTVRLQAADASARVLVIAGRPIKEPVAWQGPFVMNTREELQQAIDDYRAGRF